MKTMNTMTKSLVMALSLFLLSVNAYAAKALPGYNHTTNNKTLHMPTVDTKEQAYSIGFQELERLKNMHEGAKLSDQLRLIFNDKREKDSVTLEESNVTVQELMNEEGEIVYRGMVNVIYHYNVKSDSN
ncbi:DUF3316 domain-containing protein [Psychromonas sp. MB-3u-54]|uniref:DUF3316 domain-containing protein n=1 Tax=Psychromonas sp. MB-3u-54 TaxID=2058319 RepID=UPI0012FEBA8B|nr:DUF3316 domain-containing protein [Psychromonas sp. MB-3u-54]